MKRQNERHMGRHSWGVIRGGPEAEANMKHIWRHSWGQYGIPLGPNREYITQTPSGSPLYLSPAPPSPNGVNSYLG